MKIDSHSINIDSPVFIIAELSANHNHDFNIAKRSLIAIKNSGADAVKVQTFTPDSMTIDYEGELFMANPSGPWAGQKLYNLYKEASLPYSWHKELKDFAQELGLIFFSTPFDKDAVNFLEELNVPAYKIASLEITDIPLIEHVASKGKPLIISTGIAEEEDIKLALKACRDQGNNQIALLKCTSSYPTPIQEANIVMVKDLAERFGVISGLSDHTMGIVAPIVATAFGAKIIEKHFILDHSIGGLDSSFSLDEKDFTDMVKSIRLAEKAIGEVSYELTEKMKSGRKFCRSLYVVKDIKTGEAITEENVRSIRPGYGLHPKYYEKIIGKCANKSLKRGEPFKFGFVDI